MPNTFYPPIPRSPATEIADDIDHLIQTIPVLNTAVFPPGPNLATIGVGSVDVVADDGTASSDSYSDLELIDDTKEWDDTGDGEWAGYIVRIVGGSGIGQRRVIVSNTDTVLYVTREWVTPIDDTSIYEIISRVGSPISETILYTDIVVGALTGVTRGYEPAFSNRAWSAGTRIARVFTAQDLRALQNRLSQAEIDILLNTDNINVNANDINDLQYYFLFCRWGAI